jgi:hypothetical protein
MLLKEVTSRLWEKWKTQNGCSPIATVAVAYDTLQPHDVVVVPGEDWILEDVEWLVGRD